MERSKLKLTVIFLLVVLNLFLLGSVVLQHHQTQAYEATTRQQILLYLENHNVSVAEAVVPWETALSTQAGGPDWAAPAPAGPPGGGAACRL